MLRAGDVELNPGPVVPLESNDGCLSIVHLNMRSIRNKLDYISTHLSDIDIMCFTETHLDANIAESDLIVDTHASCIYRKDLGSHSGGLLVYVPDKLISARRPDLELNSIHAIWVEVKYRTCSFLLCNVYRSPGTPVVFWEHFNISIERALDSNPNIIIVGDLNQDLLNPNEHHLTNIMTINNLTNVINKPTRVTATSSTLIDPILVTDSVRVLHSDTMDVDNTISDHKATFLNIRFNEIIQTCTKRKVWNYDNGDYALLNELIENYNWEYIDQMDVNESCKLFTDTILRFMNQCIPSKEVTIRPNDRPWFDSETRKIIRQRDRQKHIATKSNRAADWDKYKKLRNKANNLKKAAKQHYYSNLEEKISNAKLENPKQYWKYIRHLIKTNSKSETIPILKFNHNNTDTYVYSDEEKAECLNNYFTSISSVDDSTTVLPPFDRKCNASLNSFNITVRDVEEIISTLATNKAVGLDFISHRLLKSTSKSISKPLCALFNKSLQTATFPNCWKQSLVLPLFKKGDKSCVSNYRPISLLSCVGKLMERCVYKHFYNHLHFNKLIHPKQSGFLKGHSTIHQLLDIYHDIVSAIDSKQNLCMVFCDISKAFDRVWHSGLLFKLHQYGVDGNVLAWTKNYLSNRSQSVIVGSSKSIAKPVTAGVPQGSVLGPLFFLVYVNDISDNILSISRLFADDTSLACSASNINDLEGIMNHDLAVIANWSKQWLVSFNPSKTEAILFTNHNVNNPSLVFENVDVTFVENHKHLGLTLNKHGKWKEHITNITISASKILGIMRLLKFKLRRESLNQIYISFMRPILEYASVVWDNCTLAEKDTLEKLQNEAARIVSGTTRSISLNKLYKEVGWLSLTDRRKYQKLIYTYNIINGLAPDYLTSIYPNAVSNRSHYPLRNALDIDIIARRTEIFAQSFIPSSVNLWNNLPPDIKSIQSLSLFKLRVLQTFSVSKVPKYYSVGDRYMSILHARLRNNCSDLNYDLFCNHVKDYMSCSCGFPVENAEHYFFHCPHYANQRIDLFRVLHNIHPVNLNLFLHGSSEHSEETNTNTFLSVHAFIRSTKRFDRHRN